MLAIALAVHGGALGYGRGFFVFRLIRLLGHSIGAAATLAIIVVLAIGMALMQRRRR